MTSRIFRLVSLVLAMGLVASGCGGDDDPAGRSPVLGAGGSGEIGTSVVVEATEFKFVPEVWLIAAEAETSFEMVNVGTVEHNWVLVANGSEVAGLADIQALTPSDILWEQDVLLSGESATDTFTSPSPGTFQVICSIPGHFEAGMVGSLQTAAGGEA